MKSKTLLPAAALLASLATHARAPSDAHYKGIYLGVKMSRDQIMRQLGVSKYANDPDINVWKGCDKEAKGNCAFNEYGSRSPEWLEFNTGPLCESSAIEGPGGFDCLNPWMSSVSDRHGITGVRVFARGDGTVAAIDISFDSALASEFFDIAHRQFKGTWTADLGCSRSMVIIGNTSPHHPKPDTPPLTVQRQCETLTRANYRVSMTDYDEVIIHVTPPPLYRGLLEMKLLDKEL